MLHKVYIQLIKWTLLAIEQVTIDRALAKFYRTTTPQAPIVLDVGANDGQTIRFWKRIRPNACIRAFEANPALVPTLRNLEKNGTSITIHPFGVSDKKGKRELNINVLDLTSSFEDIDMEAAYTKRKAKILGVSVGKLNAEKIEVEVKTLSSVIASLSLDRIDVLKIDTEGHEINVLRGLFTPLLTTVVERIQVEAHLDDMYSQESIADVNALLIHHGFEKEVCFKHSFGNFEERIYRRAK